MQLPKCLVPSKTFLTALRINGDCFYFQENPINAEPRSYCNYSPQRRGGQNPFKKTATKTTESPKGLKYFDTLKKDFTSTQKSNKPFGMNQVDL